MTSSLSTFPVQRAAMKVGDFPLTGRHHEFSSVANLGPFLGPGSKSERDAPYISFCGRPRTNSRPGQAHRPRSITNDFHIVLLANDDRLWPLMARLLDFGSKQYEAPLPWPCNSQLALFFPKRDMRSIRAARLLLQRGFFDLGAHLKSLCN